MNYSLMSCDGRKVKGGGELPVEQAQDIAESSPRSPFGIHPTLLKLEGFLANNTFGYGW